MNPLELLVVVGALLEQAGGGAETGYVLVIDGEGLEDLPPQVPTPQATYSVHRARTELGLRHLLWQARGAPIIAVVPEELARRIRQAPDLLRRTRNQRVHSLQVTDVLEVALGCGWWAQSRRGSSSSRSITWTGSPRRCGAARCPPWSTGGC